MKSVFSISLDNDVAMKLEEEKNVSQFINNLLKKHYEAKAISNTDELLSDLNHATNIPEEILKDFQIFDQMDEQALFTRFKEIYCYKYEKLTWKELKQAFEELKK